MKAIKRLNTLLARLPGIGPRSAQRIVYYLLRSDAAYSTNLGQMIMDIKTRVRTCEICGVFCEAERCEICTNNERDRSVICVVEQPQDVAILEATCEYHGLYHVLNGVISPLDGIGPDEIRVATLINRVRDNDIHEVIVATNPTVEGDTTAIYLHRLLAQHNVRTTRLALGLPANGDLEYADRLTITRALQGRTLLHS